MFNLRSILFFSLLMIFSTCSFALPFNIVPKQTLPTSILAGQTLTAYYTVTNNTLEQRNNNSVAYLPPNVTQVTSGGTFPNTCGKVFTLAPFGQTGSSCTLQLLISGAVNSADPDQKHHLFVCFPDAIACAGTFSQLNVTLSSAPPVIPKKLVSVVITPAALPTVMRLNINQQFTATGTYDDGSSANVTSQVTWGSSSPGVATIAPSTGLATGLTLGSTNITPTYQTLVIPPVATTVLRFAYYGGSGAGASVSSCQFDTSANFTNCGSVSGFGGFGAAVNPGGTFVYYNNFINPSDILTFCSINSNGTLNHCAHTTQQGQVGVDSFMAVNPAGNFLYIAPDNGSTFITACPINQATGDITAPCIQEPDGSTGSQYLAISPNGNFIYYTGSGSLLYAPLNSTTGAIGTPNTAGVANGHILAGVAIDPTGQFLYVANILAQGNCQLSACSVNPSTGFPTCTPSPTTVPCNQLAGITMDPLGGKVYIKTPGVNSQQCIVTGMVIGACSNMPEDNFNQLAIR